MLSQHLQRISETLEERTYSSKSSAYEAAVRERLGKSLVAYYKSLLASADYLSRKNELSIVKKLNKVD